MIPVPAKIRHAHLFERILWARENLQRIEPTYCIAWEDKFDAPLNISHATPEWLAMAMNGWLLPPVEAYLRDADRGMNERKEHPYAPPIGPMTEAQAMEYLVMKDIPRRVWDEPTNRPRFAIVRRDMIPADRMHRNAWRLADLTTRAAA